MAVLVAGLLAGCTGHQAPLPDIQGDWQLRAATIDGTKYVAADNAKVFAVSLSSLTGRAGEGISGCDDIGFRVQTTSSEFRLIASKGTMFGCLDTTPDPLDGHYLDALRGVSGGIRNGRSLTLTGPHVYLLYAETDK